MPSRRHGPRGGRLMKVPGFPRGEDDVQSVDITQRWGGDGAACISARAWNPCGGCQAGNPRLIKLHRQHTVVPAVLLARGLRRAAAATAEIQMPGTLVGSARSTGWTTAILCRSSHKVRLSPLLGLVGPARGEGRGCTRVSCVTNVLGVGACHGAMAVEVPPLAW